MLNALLLPSLMSLLTLAVMALAWAKPNAALTLLPLSVALVVGGVVALATPTLLVLAVPYLSGSGIASLVERLGVGIPGDTLAKGLILVLLVALIIRRGPTRYGNLPLFTIAGFVFLALVLPWRTVDSVQVLKTATGLLPLFLLDLVRLREREVDWLFFAVMTMPVVSVVLGMLAMGAGIQENVFKSEYTGSIRLSGAQGPAWLSYVAYIAVFMSTIAYVRRPSWFAIGCIGINILILGLAATRTPLFASFLMLALVFLSVRAPALDFHFRARVLIAGPIVFIFMIMMLWENIIVRTFEGGQLNLSGRDYIWTLFVQQIAERPWLGHGLGANTAVVPEEIARKTATVAAHNEYLRFGVDIGIFGTILFVLALMYFFSYRNRLISIAEGRVVNIFLFTLLIFSLTDNTLSALPATMMFAAFAAIYARPKVAVPTRLPRGLRASTALRAAGFRVARTNPFRALR